MSWSDTRRFARIFVALVLAGLTAGCFQPLYAERPTPAGVTGVTDRLSSVDVASIDAPSGSRLARVSAGVRNELIYDLTGGAGGASPLYRLNVRLSATQLQIIVDIKTARPDVNNYGIDADLYPDRNCDRKTGCQGSDLRPRVLQHSRTAATIRRRARASRRRRSRRQGNCRKHPEPAGLAFRSRHLSVIFWRRPARR